MARQEYGPSSSIHRTPRRVGGDRARGGRSGGPRGRGRELRSALVRPPATWTGVALFTADYPVIMANPTFMQVRRTVGRLRRHPLLYHGARYECPICEGRYRAFQRSPMGRPNALCPGCKHAERHRLLWLYLERETDLFRVQQRILHIAPERHLGARLAAIHGAGYTSGDLSSSLAMEQIDVTAIQKPDATFDVVICNHVLEHVPADITAMAEFHRVLRPGGVAIMQHPIDNERERTFEDPSVVTGPGRLRAFLQEDHVRIYGRDFDARVESVGFSIDVVRYRTQLTEHEVDRFALAFHPSGTHLVDKLSGDDIYVCTRADVSQP